MVMWTPGWTIAEHTASNNCVPDSLELCHTVFVAASCVSPKPRLKISFTYYPTLPYQNLSYIKIGTPPIFYLLP